MNNSQQAQSNGQYADKHQQYLNARQDFAQPSPAQPVQPNGQEVYINPNNFQKVLGNEAVQPTAQQSSNPQVVEIHPMQNQPAPAPQPVPVQQPVQVQPLPQHAVEQPSSYQQVPPPPTNFAPQQPVNAQTVRSQVAPLDVSQYHQAPPSNPTIKVEINSHELLKLIIYVVPVVAAFVLLFKSVDDEEVLWHTRNSIVFQALWFTVWLVLKLIDAWILSDYILGIINVVCYVTLIYAGIQAYLHKRYHIPVSYEIGKSYIEGQK